MLKIKDPDTASSFCFSHNFEIINESNNSNLYPNITVTNCNIFNNHQTEISDLEIPYLPDLGNCNSTGSEPSSIAIDFDIPLDARSEVMDAATEKLDVIKDIQDEERDKIEEQKELQKENQSLLPSTPIETPKLDTQISAASRVSPTKSRI